MINKRRFLAVAMCGVVGITFFVLTNPLPSKVTRANFIRLRTGMTPGEVEAIFGEPGEPWGFGGSRISGERPLAWTGDGTAYITFDVQRGMLGKGLWAEEGFANPVKQALEHVEVGMSRAEVNKVMGRNPDVAAGYPGIGKVSPTQIQMGRWFDIDGSGAVDFDDDERVNKTRWEGYGPPRSRTTTRFQRLLRLVQLD